MKIPAAWIPQCVICSLKVWPHVTFLHRCESIILICLSSCVVVDDVLLLSLSLLIFYFLVTSCFSCLFFRGFSFLALFLAMLLLFPFRLLWYSFLRFLLVAGIFFLLPFTIVFSWRLFLRLFPCFLTSFPYVCLYVSFSLCRFLFLDLCFFMSLSLSYVFPAFVLSFFLSRFPLSSLFFAFFVSLLLHSSFMSCFPPSFFLSFCASFFLSLSCVLSFCLSFFLSFLLLSLCRSAVSIFLAFCQSPGIPT